MKKFVVVVLLVCSAGAAYAQTPDFAVFGYGSWGRLIGSEDLTGGVASDVTLVADDFFGYGLGVNAYWTRNLSTELTVGRIDADAHLRAGVVSANLGTLEITPITLAFQFHSDPGAPINAYFGAGAAWLQFNELQSGDLTDAGFPRLTIDEEFGWLVNGGVRFGWTRNLSGRIDVKYMSTETAVSSEGEDPLDFEVSPVLVSAGIEFRF